MAIDLGGLESKIGVNRGAIAPGRGCGEKI
jgi:hypothetical protein